jgi:hypothetical protein
MSYKHELNQELIDAALNSAVNENDYKEILTWTPDVIADDMLAYADDVYDTGATAEELIPFINNWLQRNKP